MPAVSHRDDWLDPHTTDWLDPHAAEVRKLATLLEASQSLLAARNFKAGVIKVLETLGHHHGATGSTMVLLNERTREIELEASTGTSHRQTDPALTNLIGEVTRYGEAGHHPADRERVALLRS